MCLRFKRKLQQRSVKRPNICLTPDLSVYQPVTVDELQKSELEIIRIVPADRFKSEFNTLKTCKLFGAPSDRKEVSDRHKSFKSRSDLLPLY